jgi:TolB protein
MLSISPNWSPDGENLVFSALEEDWALKMINVSTGRTQDISDWPGMSTTPSFSPVNPDIIAFSSNRDGNSEIYTCRTDGKNLRRLTNHYRIDSSPTWSPDGKQIAFTSDRSGQPMIYVMNSDGSGVHRLTSRLNAYEDSPCWSPRGDRIAFVVLFDRSFDIATASPHGDDTVILTSGPGSKENPRWSPDGLKLVFSSTAEGSKNIYTMNADGSNVRLLTKGINNFSPAWAPASTGNDTRVSSRR